MTVEEVRYDDSKKWRAEDLRAIDDDTHRYEIFDAMLEVSPPASPRHREVAAALTDTLTPQLPEGVSCAAGFGFEVGASYREPDLGLVRFSGVRDGDDQPIAHDDVLLLAEIASVSSRDRDRYVKAAEYAAAGVPVYLLVSPDARQITVLRLDAETRTYRTDGVFGIGQSIELDTPLRLTILVADVVG